MKAMKKVLSVAVVGGMLAAVLTSCYKPMIDNSIEILTKDGAGKATISLVTVLGDEDGAFPQGQEAIAEAVKAKMEEVGVGEVTYDFTDDEADQRWFQSGLVNGLNPTFKEGDAGAQAWPTTKLNLTFNFSSIDDYNAKMLKLVTMYDGQTLTDFTDKAETFEMTATENQKAEATLTEKDGTYTLAVPAASLAKAVRNLHAFVYFENNTLINQPDQGRSFNNAGEVGYLSVKVGDGAAEVVKCGTYEGYGDDAVLATEDLIFADGKFADVAPSDPENPGTTDPGTTDPGDDKPQAGDDNPQADGGDKGDTETPGTSTDNGSANNNGGSTTNTNSKPAASNPKGGDGSFAALAIAMAALAAGGVVVTLKKRAR